MNTSRKGTGQVSNSFEDFWNSELTQDVSSILNRNIDITDSEDIFKNLHEYACNPDNFWPQVRSRIERLPEAFQAIKTSGDLVWLEEIRFVSDAPGKNEEEKGLGGGGASTDALIELINNAKSSIEIQTPYLVTTELGQKLFKNAVDRGVKVRILTNSLASTDNVEAFSGYQKDRRKLLNTGVRIFEYRPDAQIRKKIMTGELQNTLEHEPIFGLHAKSMVIDNRITVIGTFNLDPRSANLNTECIVIMDSEKIAKGVLSGMEEEFKPENSWETTLDFNPDREVSNLKRLNTFTRKVIPKDIL
jgi:phosphatidylserine/phosphatidylglycerophosphate/cardiolipin synthase-like enzyme